MHRVTLKRTQVAVGPDHALVLAGLVAITVSAIHLLAGEHINPYWAVAVLVAHAGVLRHLATLPVLGSMALAVATCGVSMLVSGLFLNRMVAARYLSTGWQIRHTDGDLGEYSSRFLAEEELGLHESQFAALSGERLAMPPYTG